MSVAPIDVLARIEALEAERRELPEPPLVLLQRIALLREEVGLPPHFGGTAPHRWEWWNLQDEGRLRICVYCAIVREIDS